MDFPAYRQALFDAARRIASDCGHAGQPDAVPPGALALPPQSSEGISLSLWLSEPADTIAMARFDAPPQDAAVLESLCRTIEALPLEEAAAHGAEYVLHVLAADLPRPAGTGILSAANALPALRTAQAMLRAWRAQRRAGAGMAAIEEARFLSLPSAWQALSPADRLQPIRQVLADFLERKGLASDLLSVERLEDDIRHRPVRVILSHAKAADTSGLPALMRELERRLRSDVAPWLEVYAEERVDRNALRRTILIEQR